ncbi:hypothetical protein RQP46_008354 [Phenoliferia psychrophenolica]
MNTLFVPATPDEVDVTGASAASHSLGLGGSLDHPHHQLDDLNSFSTNSELASQRIERSFGSQYEREMQLGTQQQHPQDSAGAPSKQAPAPLSRAHSIAAADNTTNTDAADLSHSTDHSTIADPDVTTRTEADWNANADKTGETQLGDFGETQAPEPRRTTVQDEDEDEDEEGDDSVMQDDGGEISMVMATAPPQVEVEEEEAAETQLEPTQLATQPSQPGDDSLDMDIDDERSVAADHHFVVPTPPQQLESSHRLRTGPRNSHATLDAPSAPSSSAVVARDLLSPKKAVLPGGDDVDEDGLPPSSGGTEAEPQSSADPDLTKSFLVSPPKKSSKLDHLEKDASGASSLQQSWPQNLSHSRGDASAGFSGPETSTPATFGASPPRPPLTAKRTLPPFTLLPDQTLPNPLSVPAKVATPVAKLVFQSADVLKNLAVKPPSRKREAWDILDQDTDSQRSDLEEEEEEEKQGEDDGEKDMTLDGDDSLAHVASQGSGAATPRPTANATTDMDLDVDESSLQLPLQMEDPTNDSLLLLEEPKDESSLDQSVGPSAPPAHQPTAPEPSDTFSSSVHLPVHQDTPLFGPAFDDSQSQSIDSHAPAASHDESSLQEDDSMHRRRLTDISELKSSMEHQDLDDESQIVVEPTQVEYDIEVYNNNSNATGAFLHDTSADTSSTSRRSFREPPPGRELSRRPPPPSSIPANAESQEDDSLDSPAIPLRITTASSAVPDPVPFPAAQPPSSPPVPLATANLSVPSHQASHPASNSSTGIVPDSQVPSDESAPPKVSPVASTSIAVPAAAAAQASSSKDLDVVQPNDFYGGGEAEPEAEEVAPDSEEEREDEEPEDDVVPVAVKGKGKAPAANGKGKRKGKGKVGRPAKAKPATKAPSKKAAAKGKGRAKSPSPAPDSADELDLLEQPIEVEESFNETNYEDLPLPSNARRTSRGRTSAASAAAPSPVRAAAPGKRRQSANADTEAPPAKRQKSVPAPKKAPLPKSDAPAAVKRKPGRPRKNAKSASASVEPENAVAGPSRGVRFDEGEDAVMDDAPERSVTPADAKPRHEPHLLESAPFERAFGIWGPNLNFYPCQILECVGGKLKVRFDDGMYNTLTYNQVRRCELEVDDWLEYRGDDFSDPETQVPVLEQHLRVLRVERNVTGDDADGQLFRDDIIVVTPDAAGQLQEGEAPRKMERITVDSIFIAPAYASQFDNRKLTVADIAGFEGRERDKPTLVSVAPAKAKTTFEVNKIKGILDGYAFILTWTRGEGDKDKDPKLERTKAAKYEARNLAFGKTVLEHGGTVISLEQLFEVVAEPDSTEIVLRFNPPAFAGIDNIFLLTDLPHTTEKYLVSLALGIPCVSYHLVTKSIEKGEAIDWRQLALTSGYSRELEAWVIGGQQRALAKTSFNLASISSAVAGGIFQGSPILFVISKKGKKAFLEQAQTWQRIVAAAGASQIDFVISPEAASTAVDYDFVILEDEKMEPTADLEEHEGVRTADWVKACLIAGMIVDA